MKKNYSGFAILIVLAAISICVGCPASKIASLAAMAGDNSCSSPSFNLNSGTYPGSITVTIATQTDGAAILYTLDGTDPASPTGKVYHGSIILSDPVTVRAIARKSGWTDSAEASATYVFSPSVSLGTNVPATGSTPEEFILPGYRDSSGNMTEKESGYPVSGHWTLAGSPYKVNGNLFVKKGEALVIDPGVKVVFQGRFWLRLMGGMTAKGTASSMIAFTTTDSDIALGEGWIGWYGISICGDDYDHDAIDHGPAIWDFEFCEIAYVDKNDRTPGHPWEKVAGNFYTHGASDTDLVFDDNYLHHGRSGLFDYFGAFSSTLFAEPTFHRNVFEKAIYSPPISVCHVYLASDLQGPGIPNYFMTRFVGGAVRDFYVGTQSAYATVAYCWDTPIILDRVEVTNCGDNSETEPWFNAACPNVPPDGETWASITYIAP
jgi:hypothetical protein